MKNALEVNDVYKYVATCAKQAEVSIEWKENAVPSVTLVGGSRYKMTLPTLHTSMTEKDLLGIRQFVKHETSHILYTHFAKKGEDEPANNSLLHLIHNAIEDHRVDHINDSQYDGDRLIQDAFFNDFISEKWNDTSRAPKEVGDYLAPLFAWSIGQQGDLYSCATHLSKKLEDAYSKNGKEAANRFASHPEYAERMHALLQIEDNKEAHAAGLKLAEDILKNVFQQDPEKQKQKAKGQQEDGEGEGDGNDKRKGNKPSENDGLKKAAQQYSMSDVYHEKASFTPSKVDHHSGTSAYTPDPPNVINVVKLAGQGGGDAHYKAGIAQHVTNDTGFANKVRTYLQVMTRNRYEYGKKRGKLNSSAISRVTLRDAPGYNERIFKRHIESKALDISISLLVDCSGSMGGDPYTLAATSAVMLATAFGNVLKIPIEVLGFTEDSRTRIYLFKEYAEHKIGKEELINRFAVAANKGMMNNTDGEAIAYAHSRILQQPTKRKMLIVLSDGQPAGGSRKGDIQWYTKKVIKDIENHSPVEMMAIGLGYSGVKSYYKNSVFIKSVSELEHQLLTLVSKNILK